MSGFLGRAANDRMLRRQRPGAMCVDGLGVQHRAHVVQRQFFHLRDFVRRPEAVEEVKERDSRSQACAARDQREVHDFLHGIRCEQRESGAAAGHHIALITKD
jgi:hypothetical protein